MFVNVTHKRVRGVGFKKRLSRVIEKRIDPGTVCSYIREHVVEH